MIGLNLLASATEYLCGILVLGAFFPRRSGHDRLIITAMFLCGIIHTCISSFASACPLYISMVCTITNWFVIFEILFSGNFWKKVFVIFFFWAVTFAVDSAVLAVTTTILNISAKTAVSQEACYLLGAVSSRSLLLSISFGCAHIVRRQERRQKGGSVTWIVLLFIPFYTMVGTGALITNAMQGSTLSSGVIALSGELLCVNVLLCLVVNKLEQNRMVEEEKRALLEEAAHNLALAKDYQASFEQQRRATHEFRNQLDAIESLLAQGEYDRAASYIRNLLQISQELIPLIRTNHPMVDAVLNQKYQQAVQKGIGMLLTCNDLSGIPMEDADIVTLLGNILDNAISASANTQEKKIWVKLWMEHGICQLVVRNSCPDGSSPDGEQDNMLHGFGLGLVKAVLGKYEDSYFAGQKGDEYIFSAILG